METTWICINDRARLPTVDSPADPLRHLHEHVARLLSEVHGAAARAN